VKLIKAILFALALALSAQAFAITDEESMAFVTAVDEDDAKTVAQMIDSGLVPINEKRAFFGWTPLQMAANKNKIEVLKAVLARKPDMNVRHEMSKNTALHLAAMNGNKQAVELLLAAGADPNVKMRAGVSIVRVLRDMGSTEMLDILVKAGAKDDGRQDEKCF